MDEKEQIKLADELLEQIDKFASEKEIGAKDMKDITSKITELMYQRYQYDTIKLHKNNYVGKYFKYYEWPDEKSDDYVHYVYVTDIFGSLRNVVVNTVDMDYEHGKYYDQKSSYFTRFMQFTIHTESTPVEEQWKEVASHFVEITEEEFFSKVKEEIGTLESRMKEWIKKGKKEAEENKNEE